MTAAPRLRHAPLDRRGAVTAEHGEEQRDEHAHARRDAQAVEPGHVGVEPRVRPVAGDALAVGVEHGPERQPEGDEQRGRVERDGGRRHAAQPGAGARREEDERGGGDQTAVLQRARRDRARGTPTGPRLR